MQGLLKFAAAGLLAFGSLTVSAASFSGGAGLSGPLLVVTDFSDAVAALGADVVPGAFYGSVTFSEFLLGPSVTGGSGIRTLISPVGIPESSISFASPVAAIALLSRDKVPTRLSIYLAGALVDSFDTDGAGYATPRYYGFAGVVFDKLVLTQETAPPALLDRLYAVDQLQVRAVPLPATWVSFAAGCWLVSRTGRRASRPKAFRSSRAASDAR